ncbi:MAG: hypothetical protein NUV46_02240 [Nanoarchaeota archaeon]|nr:hypothetical protein [Nanoarchaeota archaeon]
MNNKLEIELFNKVQDLDDLGKDFSLEDSLLIVSGVDSVKKLKRCKKKIGKLHSLYKNYSGEGTDFERAKLLFKFLWKGKYDLYLEGNHPDDFNVRRLDRAVEKAILRKDNSIGNCVGLTNLGAILGLREGLKFCSLIFPDHVALSLRNKRKRINLDLTSEDEGFNFKYSNKDKKNMSEKRIEYLLPILIGEKSNSKAFFGDYKNSFKYAQKAFEITDDKDFFSLLGWLSLNTKNFVKSREYNEKSINFNKRDPIPYLNNSVALMKVEKYKKALKNINIGINIDPKDSVSYLYRADLHFRMSNYEKSLKDYQKALSIKDEEFGKGDLEFAKRRIKRIKRKLNRD